MDSIELSKIHLQRIVQVPHKLAVEIFLIYFLLYNLYNIVALSFSSYFQFYAQQFI